MSPRLHHAVLLASLLAPGVALLTGPAALAQDEEAAPEGQVIPVRETAPAPDQAPAQPQPQPGAEQAGAEPGQAQGPTPEELQALQAQVLEQQAELEQLRQQTSDQAEQNQHLQEMVGQLQGLRDQVAGAQAWAQQREAERQARLLTLDRSTDLLRQADTALAYGDTSRVDDLLQASEAAMNGQAQVLVAAARDALANGDLYHARAYAEAAMAAGTGAQLNGTDSAVSTP